MGAKVSDVNSGVVAAFVARATGRASKREKDPGAVARGRLGGQARARNTPHEERSKDAREAVNARWAAEK